MSLFNKILHHGFLSTSQSSKGTAEQAITNYAYDGRGNLTQITDPLGRISRFFYDSLNRITATLGADPDGSPFPLLGPATRFDYDVFNNLTATETINSYFDVPANKVLVTGTKTFTTYSGIDLPTNQFEQNPSVTWYLYPSGASVLQTNVKATATAAAVITDAQLAAYLSGNSVIINTPNIVANQGLTTTIAYNQAGDATSITATPVGTATAARVTSFEYDRLGRTTQVLSPDHVSGLIATPQDRKIGNRFLTNFTYDNIDNLLETNDPLGNKTAQNYDSLNRVISQTLPSATVNGAVGAATTIFYEQARTGWVTARVNSENQVLRSQADSLGRLISVTGDTPLQTLAYWTDGSLKSNVDASGYATLYDYTLRGQLKTTTQPSADGVEAAPRTRLPSLQWR